MRYKRTWPDPERWSWFAAGNPEVARKATGSSQTDNSPRRLLFEAGLVLLVPLALAALIEIILGT